MANIPASDHIWKPQRGEEAEDCEGREELRLEWGSRERSEEQGLSQGHRWTGLLWV
jgi:hypothetical protein